ncbi:unnamed protein product, partial [Staurois parvus]
VAACCSRPLPRGRFLPAARGPCPGVDCLPVARDPCSGSPIRCPVTEGARLRPQA